MNRTDILQRLRAARPIVAPSMLKCDFGNLAREVERLTAANAKVLHWDVMDGHFVPNLSYGPMVIERVRPLTEMVFDAHLMISEPEKCLDEYLKAGCEAITVHIEAVPQPTSLLRRIRDAGRVAGLALNPQTPLSAVTPFLAEIDLLLVMSVQAGFGGQSFIPASIEKLKQARQMISSETILSVDGGIGTKTIAGCAAVGTDLFVAGSAIFDQSDYRVAVEELTRLAT
ncbi:MAG: ribulose-phosphate 3-epimerase [Planctomycetota bacterium]|nr:MAG: ribulose-phosphate 3-epimerase [Planctomycetota bacterium]